MADASAEAAGPDGVVLETERIVLRRLTMADLDALARLYADPEVRRWFPDGVRTHEQTREELAWIIDVDYGRYGYGLWATILKENGAFHRAVRAVAMGHRGPRRGGGGLSARPRPLGSRARHRGSAGDHRPRLRDAPGRPRDGATPG